MKTCKRLLSSFLVLALMVTTLTMTGVQNVQAATNKAIVAIEKFTIGQGYLIEPTEVSFEEGDTVQDVVYEELDKAGYTYEGPGYLNYINQADSGKLNIPSYIQNMGDYVMYGGDKEAAPTNDAKNTLANNALGSFSYTQTSGWMYSVNGTVPDVGMSDYQVESGDVIRVQFSVFGYGSDIGAASFSEINQNIPAREEITKKLAVLNANKDALNNKTWKSAYENANKVATDLEATKETIDRAAAALPEEKEVTDWVTEYNKAKITLNYKNYISLAKGKSTTKVKLASANKKGDALKSSKSSNPSVAVTSVKNGVLKVTAKKAGTTTVTVTSKEGAKATFKVRVFNATVKLNYKKQISLKAKTSTTKVKLASSNVKGDKIVSAKSSNTSVVVNTVKNGKLTIKGKKKGTAKVTVKTLYGGSAVLTVVVK